MPAGPRSESEPVVTHPAPHQQTPPPTPAPVFDSRRNRYIDPETNRIVKAPEGGESRQAPVEPEPVAPAAPIQHTALTLDLARQAGIPEHIIASTPTADLRAEIALLQQFNAARTQKPVAAPAAEEPIDWGINPETKLPFKESDFDEYPLHKQMVKSQHEMKKELSLTKRGLAEMQRKTHEQAQQSSVDRLNALCDSHPEIFGTQDSPAGSPEAISRQMMFNQLTSLVTSKQHTTLDKDYQRMLVAFQRQTPAAPLQEATGRITQEQWERSGLAQTAHRNTAPIAKTRRQKIADRVDDDFRRNGIKTSAGPSSDLSDLPPR